MSTLLDRTGQIFGRLVVLRRGENGGDEVRWICLCECGNTALVFAQNLRAGSTQSCGCLQSEVASKRLKTHGCSNGTKEYESWHSAKGRCFNKNDKQFRRYGGRGITMCEKWRTNFAEFLKDMGLCPDGLTLDRINTNGNYEPDNCRWATSKQQCRNRRSNRVLTVKGISKCLAEWSEISGIQRSTIQKRIDDFGWSQEMAVITPARPIRRAA